MHRVAVIGASGYTGVELLRLLAGHPQVTVSCVTSRQQAGQALAEVFPSLAGVYDLTFEALEPAALAGRADLVFTAVPHQAAMAMVPELLAAGCKVVDLSADYRLRDAAVYASGTKPTRPRSCWPRPSTGSLNSTGSRCGRRGWSPTRVATRPASPWR